jgi:hypothetical protein
MARLGSKLLPLPAILFIENASIGNKVTNMNSCKDELKSATCVSG